MKKINNDPNLFETNREEGLKEFLTTIPTVVITQHDDLAFRRKKVKFKIQIPDGFFPNSGWIFAENFIFDQKFLFRLKFLFW